MKFEKNEVSNKKPNFYQIQIGCFSKYAQSGIYSSLNQLRGADLELHSVAFFVPIISVSTRYSSNYTTNITKL